MYHNRPAEDTFRPDQLDEVVGQGAFSVALRVGFEVSEVTDVALRVGGGAMGLGVGVDCVVRGLVWRPGGRRAVNTYSVVRHSYSRWCYPQIDEYACPVQRRNRYR